VKSLLACGGKICSIRQRKWQGFLANEIALPRKEDIFKFHVNQIAFMIN